MLIFKIQYGIVYSFHLIPTFKLKSIGKLTKKTTHNVTNDINLMSKNAGILNMKNSLQILKNEYTYKIQLHLKAQCKSFSFPTTTHKITFTSSKAQNKSILETKAPTSTKL